MNFSYFIKPLILALVLARWAAELCLRWLNKRHVLAHAGAVPEEFKGTIDDATYAKSVQYSLAKSRLAQVEDCYNVAILLALLFSGVLPWAFYGFTGLFG